jgi:zinc transporter 2
MPAADPKLERAKKAIQATIGFCFVFMIVEVYFGLVAHSLAVLTDALHMLTDVASLALSLFAMIVSTWESNHKFSFGFIRAEVVGAMGSVFLIWALVGVILYEAITRLLVDIACHNHSEDKWTKCEGIEAPVMLYVGCAGFCSNLVCAAILGYGGHAHTHGGKKCDGGHGHAHGGTDDAHADSCGGGDEHGHSHGDSDHGHSHGGSDHGHSHGDAAVNVNSETERDGLLTHNHDADHGHSHEESHGHSHGDGGDEGSQNLNIRGALLHTRGDGLQSLGVVLAAGMVGYGAGGTPHPRSMYIIADPVCSLVFSVITLYTTRYLVVDVFHILMEATPADVDYAEIEMSLRAVEGVTDLHDLHIWALAPGATSLAVHLVAHEADATAVLRRAADLLGAKKIRHSTIQVDPDDSRNPIHGGGSDCPVSPMMSSVKSFATHGTTKKPS